MLKQVPSAVRLLSRCQLSSISSVYLRLLSTPSSNACSLFPPHESKLLQPARSVVPGLTFLPPSPHKRWFGQPAPQTHPHLINNGEVTPNITKKEYRRRRSMLVYSALQRESTQYSPGDHHLFIIPSACKVHMTQDIPYVFRQHSDFLYLSGFLEPNSVLVIHAAGRPSSALDNHSSVLFVPQKDAHAELWEGPRSGAAGAVELTGVDCAYGYNQLESYLSDYCKKRDSFTLWYEFTHPPHSEFHNSLMSRLICEKRHGKMENVTKVIHGTRSRKSPAEVELMQQSCQIACEAFVQVMKFSHPQIPEAHLWAKMDFECRVRGAQYLAYPPVVAGGPRANIIHYIANNQVVEGGQLVLMDAGCELHGYTSDITRTWPVNGSFSPAQRELYEAVLAVQEACIAWCTTSRSLDDVHKQMLALLGIQLQKLGIVPIDAPSTEVIKRAKLLCPHHVGHYLGMDVHDVGEMSRNITMEPGMVVTVEPGIYVNSDDTSVPEQYRGIGIRIEDNILITEAGPVNLSKHCPRTVQDIEAVLSQR